MIPPRHAALKATALIIGALASGSALAAPTDCYTANFNPLGSICDHCVLQGQLIVAHDQPCYRTPLYTPREPVEFLATRIATPASHGVASTNGTGIVYTPAKDYSGGDSFEVETTFRRYQETGTYRTRWTVTVK